MMAEELAPRAILPESWSVKEVVADLKKDLVDHLDKQDTTLGEISRKVDSKADKADLVVLGIKIEGHGERISQLEQHRTEQLAASQLHRRLWAAVGTVGGIVAILIAGLIDSHII